MNNIVDPISNKKYNIFSKQGKQILKKMIKSHNGGMALTETHPLYDKERREAFLMATNKLGVPINKIRNLKAIQKHISEYIPDKYYMLKNLWWHNKIYIQDSRKKLDLSHKKLDINAKFPYNLSEYNYFSEKELENLRKNNINTLIQLVGKFFSFYSLPKNDNDNDDNIDNVDDDDEDSYVSDDYDFDDYDPTYNQDNYRDCVMEFFNFLEPLFDYQVQLPNPELYTNLRDNKKHKNYAFAKANPLKIRIMIIIDFIGRMYLPRIYASFYDVWF